MLNVKAQKQEKMLILLAALLQGLALLLMHNWVISLHNLSDYYQVIWPLYTVIVTLPLTFMMLANQPRKLLLELAIIFSVIAAICAAYIGHISNVKGLPNYAASGSYWLLGFCIFIVWFIVIAFFEHYCQFKHWHNRYDALFNFSWRNAVKIITASLFVGLFWAALLLLAGLFKILGIHFFEVIINHRQFIYPATTMAFGLGLSLYAAKEEALSEFKRAILQVLGYLLPLVSVILVAFVATLPFKGINTLWATGYATGLMLSLMTLMIFLVNAAFQDGSQIKYPVRILQLANIGLLVMPIYVLLCVYAMYLRVHQYGWTDDRVWAASLVVMVAIYAFGYAYAAAKSFIVDKQNWLQFAKKVNIFAALSLIVLLALINSPVLNPTRIGVQSQLAKLLNGSVNAAQFDYQYLRFKGGQYGNEALQALVNNKTLKDAATIKPLAEAALKAQYQNFSAKNNPVETIESLQAKLQVYPKGASLDVGFYQALLLEANKNQYDLSCLNKTDEVKACKLLLIDLNNDHKNEAVLINNYSHQLFMQDAKGWQHVGDLRMNRYGAAKKNGDSNALETGDYKAVIPKWQELEIGQQLYAVEPCCKP